MKSLIHVDWLCVHTLKQLHSHTELPALLAA